MTPTERCKECGFLIKISNRLQYYWGCTHRPYHGKCIAEIKVCPKVWKVGWLDDEIQ